MNVFFPCSNFPIKIQWTSSWKGRRKKYHCFSSLQEKAYCKKNRVPYFNFIWYFHSLPFPSHSRIKKVAFSLCPPFMEVSLSSVQTKPCRGVTLYEFMAAHITWSPPHQHIHTRANKEKKNFLDTNCIPRFKPRWFWTSFTSFSWITTAPVSTQPFTLWAQGASRKERMAVVCVCGRSQTCFSFALTENYVASPPSSWPSSSSSRSCSAYKKRLSAKWSSNNNSNRSCVWNSWLVKIQVNKEEKASRKQERERERERQCVCGLLCLCGQDLFSF